MRSRAVLREVVRRAGRGAIDELLVRSTAPPRSGNRAPRRGSSRVRRKRVLRGARRRAVEVVAFTAGLARLGPEGVRARRATAASGMQELFWDTQRLARRAGDVDMVRRWRARTGLPWRWRGRDGRRAADLVVAIRTAVAHWGLASAERGWGGVQFARWWSGRGAGADHRRADHPTSPHPTPASCCRRMGTMPCGGDDGKR